MLPTFNVPPIGPIQGKLWGTTQLVFACSNVECHRLEINKGGFSSRHIHAYKWNRFILISGEIVVRIYQDHEIIDETILQSGQITDVAPNTIHMFEAMQDSRVIELYWASLDANDIDRNGSQGGLKS